MRFANEQRQPGEGKQERRGRVEGEGESEINNNKMSGLLGRVWFFLQPNLVHPSLHQESRQGDLIQVASITHF